jgi:hypothetical protein
MSGKQLMVCLLALTGSASVLRLGLAGMNGALRPRDPPRVFRQTTTQYRRPGIVSTHETKSWAQDVHFAGVGPGPTRSVRSNLSNVRMPMAFEPNRGQTDASVEYVGRGKRLTVFLTGQEIAIRVAKPGGLSPRALSRPPPDAHRESDGALILRVAGNNEFAWKGAEKLRGESNYFVGNDPRKWHAGVPHFARVETRDASRGVGMAVYGNDEGVEYDLRVAPGGDVSKLRLRLTGAQNVRLDSGGDLLLNVGGDEVRMKKPSVYEQSHHGWHSSGSRRHGAVGARRARKYSPRRSQRPPGAKVAGKNPRPRRAANPCAPRSPRAGQATTAHGDIPCPVQPAAAGKSGTSDGSRVPSGSRKIAGDYVIEADGSIGFRIGPHDPNATLVVDPSLSVAYGTFLGGSGTDSAAGIALDSTGKIYVSGTTASATFPGSSAAKLGPADSPPLFFIAKIDPTMTGASSLIYLTFFGGSGTQAGGLIAVDGNGDVAITGTTTATDFPVTDTSHPTSGLVNGDGNDVIVSEIAPAGNSLIFSTLFGGSGTQSQAGPGGIALDATGDVYIASDVHTTSADSASADLPVTTGAFQTTWDGEPADGFLAIFTPPAGAGGAAVLKYCTYLGTNSNGQPGVGGVAVDASGNAYIAGFTSNSVNGFPVKNAIQTAYGGGTSDAFLMKISPTGNGANDLVYATLLGGSGTDQALAVALDSASPPNAYLTGTTGSPNFPTGGMVGAYQSGRHANATMNAFLSVVAQNAISGQASLAYSTYFGGSNLDAGQGVAVSAPNAAYVTGTTSSFDFPWHDNLQAFNGAGDAFVAKWDPTSAGPASLIYVTPLGGTSPAGGSASAQGNAVAAGQSGHVYVAGSSTSADFPTAVTTESALNGFQPSCASCQFTPPLADAFVAEIVESATPMPSVYFNVGRVNFQPMTVGTTSDPQLVAAFNGGEAAVTVSDIEITGVNAADFSIIGGSACIGEAISPGTTQTCSFEVQFTPSITGPEAAVVAISDNAPGSPQILELMAAGQPALAAISPSNLNFGDQPENSTSAAQSIMVTNVGSQILTVQFNEAGPDSGQFAVVAGGEPGSSACGFPLQPGQNCVLVLAFEPNAERTFDAELDLTYNPGQQPSAGPVVALTGVGTAKAPIVSFSAPSLIFGNENVGSQSGAQSVTLTNQGSATLNISSMTLTGSNASDFAIAVSGTSCPLGGGTVVVQASCTVAVQLAPQSTGPKNASLSFTDNAPGSAQQVALYGAAIAGPSLEVSPPSLTFGAQSEGVASVPQNVTILNSGGAADEVSGIKISGANAGDFSSPAGCTPNPVPAGSSCQIGVTFTPGPSGPGVRTATLSVPGGTPPTVALSGTATQAAVSVPSSVSFGSQLAGGAGGTPQPIVVTNSSSGASAGTLTITSVTRTGSNPSDFAVSADSCTGANTAPGATCTIQVAFKPLQLPACGANGGARTATLTLNDNVPGSPQNIPLSGTAMDFCINAPAGEPVLGSITPGQSSTYMLEIDSSAGFTGAAALSCSVPAALMGACKVTTTPSSNPPVVQISPGSPGEFQLVVTTTTEPSVGSLIYFTRPQTASRPGGIHSRWILAFYLVMLAAWMLRRRRPSVAKLAQIVSLLLASAIAMSACGGGASTADPPPGTPPGTYPITVTATVTPTGQPSVTRTLVLNLTVNQPPAN